MSFSNTKIFGQAQRSSTRYQRQMGNSSSTTTTNPSEEEEERLALLQKRIELKRKKQKAGEELDERFGYKRYDYKSVCEGGEESSRRGWIFNMLPTTVPSPDGSTDLAAVDLYFLTSTSATFKSTILHSPYFYLLPSITTNTTDSLYQELVISHLLRKYEGNGLKKVEVVYKQDLDAVNHLTSEGRCMFQLVFDNVQSLTDTRSKIQDMVKSNASKAENAATSFYPMDAEDNNSDPLLTLTDMREYDVPYLVRTCIDLDIRTGSWYTVTPTPTSITLTSPDAVTKASPKFLAFDIECTKAPLKFPDANVDSIFMISYMIEGQGYLILSRHVVGENVENFEYTPMKKYPGPFIIYNEWSEKELIARFISEYQRMKPQIVVTYNGDFFDWPFLEARAALYGFDLGYELGVECVSSTSQGEGEYRGRCCVHLDAFHWVKRDSYLPQGSQGLKAVTKYKLGYDPVEVDPEDMVRYAMERPTHMAQYSVSDAVATYYLYEKYVHMFIFSLATIIPMNPEDVLRKGSGTLCETLLMVQACQGKIICPNKQVEPHAKFHNGHLISSETYIGGKVECLETGVYRSDVEYKFDLIPSAFQGLIDHIDRDLTFAIEVEGGLDRSKITNYDDIRCEIIEALELLRDRPVRMEKPFIYHLDVGAMYPNIILTNRLQPSAIVDDATCAACDFNQAKNNCKRHLDWVWRVDYNPATKSEYKNAKDQLARETFVDEEDGQLKSFFELKEAEQEKKVRERLSTYAKNAYKKTKVTEEVVRREVVCMRENDFYVDTVRQFRDRRYEYKKMTKVWKKKIGSASDAVSKKEAEDRALVYDSLQVAHKCILNSFYGYVMRKGARWRSMEMAGIVTKTGADCITEARKLVEQIGRPLELDTDGIWCILPQSFPNEYFFKLNDGSKLKLEYPCVMLNADAHDKFTNHQYQTLKDKDQKIYETRSECSIFFEVDGPYRCMVIPASTEEGKLLKKRYAVFNFDGSLAELKGFELKRRGELELIKTFQSQVFERFLDGESLVNCYDSVAEVANHWIDVLDTQGESLETDELIDLISENRSMSRQLADYGDQKGTSQTTARRLGEFLGAEIIKDKGLNCKFIIAEHPYGAPVTERAIPTAIWKAEPAVMKHYLRKWLKNPGMDGDDFDIRNVLDWDYYIDRLGKTIQKIITIPAALQRVENPVPRVPHPEWLQRKVRILNDRFQQRSITSMFSKVKKSELIKNKGASEKRSQGSSSTESSSVAVVPDIEDFGGGGAKGPGRPIVHTSRRRRGQPAQQSIGDDNVNLKKKELGKNDENSLLSSEEAVPAKIALSKESFPDWLAKRKNQWRSARKERQKRAHDFGNASSSVTDTRTSSDQRIKKPRRGAGNMEAYIREAASALTHHEWHIIEIRDLSVLDTSSSVGSFLVWVMMGNNSLQKVNITVPRTVYLSCQGELAPSSSNMMDLKSVEKHLPHNKSSTHLYEATLPEVDYSTKNWIADLLRPSSNKDGQKYDEKMIESVYETSTPLLLKALINLGCVTRVSKSAQHATKYVLSDLARVDNPSEGEYLHHDLSYRRIFLYESLNVRNKTGLIAVFVLDNATGERGQSEGEDAPDWSRPTQSRVGSLKMNATCHLWVVKPGATKGQKNVSTKQCENLFGQLLNQVRGLSSNDDIMEEDNPSDYACLSPETKCTISSLSFADTDKKAFSGVNNVLNQYSQSNHGPTFLLLNSMKPLQQIRRDIPSCNAFPLVILPFPPGPAHSSPMSVLPSLNWEPMAVQLVFEAYFYFGVVSYPKRVSYARFGHIPIGNLGADEAITLYDVNFGRQLQSSRALLWASEMPGLPDLGCSASYIMDSCGSAGIVPANQNGVSNNSDMWGDDDELISPVIRHPGTYRNICVEIDVHDLAIAALTDSAFMSTTATSSAGANKQRLNTGDGIAGSSANGGILLSMGADSFVSSGAPLGDEMSTSISLPLLRGMVHTWLRQAQQFNDVVADDILHHVYRLVCSPEAMLNDPALHRIVHSLMKSTFLRLLGEFKRLGSTIVCATFQRIVIATNKMDLQDAQEYVEFVISTIQKRGGGMGWQHAPEGLARIALRPSNFYAHYLFLDENNFGGIRFEQRPIENEEESEWALSLRRNDGDTEEHETIIPTVISGWNIMHYLASDLSQEYFRAIIGRFSKDSYRKQMQLIKKTDGMGTSLQDVLSDRNGVLKKGSQELSLMEQLVNYNKKMVSKHFASYLTRAVGEIVKDGGGPESFPHLPGSHLALRSPGLEFVKNVMVVLELDSDVQQEVHILKKSLLAQLGIQEYSESTKWVNPSASFILPDVFCQECHESRDVDLCVLPPSDDEENQSVQWLCEDCGSPYDTEHIERRLVDVVQRKTTQYQLQDLRCTKTERVAIRALAYQSDCSAKLKLDIPQKDFISQISILRNLAKFHDLDWLTETTEGILRGYAT